MGRAGKLLQLLGLSLWLAGCGGGEDTTRKAAEKVAPPPDDPAAMTPLQRAQAGKALWEEKCRTVAGEKIYKTASDIDGVLLLKVRPKASTNQWADPNWPGAAFAIEDRVDDYIKSFLGFEMAMGAFGAPRPITKDDRGFINTTYSPGPKQYPGYRYVDVADPSDGKRYRYRLGIKVVQGSKTGELRTFLEKTLAPEPSPLYGVDYEDHVIPEDRALGVASSTVRVINLRTGEVLGEMLRYAWSTPASGANPNPWLTAYKCPGHAMGSGEATRKFVDQVLIPRKDQ
ncbi:hypothetical protein [Pseudomonas sp. SCB32]|uniref:hypothetical protein n=1 Tax=Pseudomonas sp. SCB32 TaxID=2653853 RepID=UPI001265260B|nr:hypothetical protein [Pseudomonas sp. SCB32]